MKVFIKKVLVFLSILLFYTSIMYLLNFVIFKLQTPENIKTNILIIGDSHPQTSINPELFESAINNCQQAEPYYISYWKLKKFLTENRADTVIIGFSYHNISGFNDEKLSDPFWASEMFRRIYLLKDFRTFYTLTIDTDMAAYFRVLFSNMCLYPKSHKEYVGGFDPEPAVTNLSNVDNVIQRHYYVDNEVAEISDISIQYLDSIIHICTNNNAIPVLVSNPLHEEYIKKIPEKFKNTFFSLKEKYRSNKTLIIDYSSKSFKDEYFFNPDHLNIKGSEIFTLEILSEFQARKEEKRSRNIGNAD